MTLRRLLTILLLAAFTAAPLGLPLPAALASDVKTVEVSGQGSSEKEAREDAMRNAAEKAVGVMIQSDTQMRDFQIQSDRVRTQAEAFIESYDVLSKRTSHDGLVEVTIRATVNAGSIKDGVQALRVLQERLNNPNFAVINDGGRDHSDPNYEVNVAAAGAINKFLGARLLNVADPKQIEALRQDDALIEEAQNARISVAQQIANKIKADIYVTVIGHVERSASLNVRFFESSTGRILGEESAYTSVLGGSHAEQKLAVEQATLKAAEKAFSTLLNYWKRDTDQGSQITVIVNGLDFRSKVKFSKLLQRIGRDVKQLSASSGRAEYVVWSQKPAAELAEEIGMLAEEEKIGRITHDPNQRGSRIIFSFIK
jgi:hypothetical protein